jgi:hypothetical protein
VAAHDDLLGRFQPQLRYDTNETFFADSAAQLTDDPGDQLRRAPAAGGTPGEVLASGGAGLSLDLLSVGGYGDGKPFMGGDRLGYAGRDYRDRGRILHMHDEYKNVCYGRAKQGGDGRLWLQYWFFYFYNDYNLAGGIGLHEGDWEMVQLRMGEGGAPDLAIYAQHRYAEARAWHDVEKVDGTERPVVYPGRGSHASYFEPGVHKTEVWIDIADGERESPDRLRLIVLDEDGPPWAVWPGRWGDTEARVPGVDSPSPDGPGGHAQWDDPATLLDTLRDHALAQPEPPPSVKVSRAGGHLRLDYDFSAPRPGALVPARLVVTVNSRDEPAPPATYTFVLDSALRGRIDTRRALDDAKRYDVHVSAVSATGEPTASARTLLGARTDWQATAAGILERIPVVGPPLGRLLNRRGAGA